MSVSHKFTMFGIYLRSDWCIFLKWLTSYGCWHSVADVKLTNGTVLLCWTEALWLAVRPADHAMSLSNLIAWQAVAHIQIKTNICRTILCHVGSLELQKAAFMLCKINYAGNDVLIAYSCICPWASYQVCNVMVMCLISALPF